MARIAIVEDHRLIVDMLSAALAPRGIDAVPIVCDGERDRPLLERVLSVHPDLVLLDLDLGDAGDGLDLVGPLTAAGIRILLVTGLDEPLRIAAGMEAGAVDYQPKAAGFDALLAAVVAVLDGKRVLDKTRRERLLHALHDERARQAREFVPFERLTSREREVLEALADGRSVRQIAADWTVSDTTVRAHVRAILAKLGASSQLGAVGAALRAGWLRPRPERPRIPGVHSLR
jgi:DNA-binding NarL/FixJ family response regulator